MNTLDDKGLERAVGELTRWGGPRPEVWQRAVAEVEAEPRGPRDVIGRVLMARLSPRWLAIAAVLVVLIGAGIVAQLNESDSARRAAMSSSRPTHSLSNLQEFDAAHATYSAEWDGDAPSTSRFLAEELTTGPSIPGGGGIGGGPSLSGGESPARPRDPREFTSQQDEIDQLPADRAIIRKATMEIETSDVRSAYLRAAQLISEARGEFIDDSALRESENGALTAHLTLRIRADRLDEVLQDLRGLGTVDREESRGEDVTSQIVDVEARIRNEQRVEQELLELLAGRQDAPLKEILELRNEISRVRGRIEQYTAQVQNLGKLVSLTTVLVIIHADAEDATDEPDESGIGEYFADMITDAWQGGIRFLAGSIAVIIRSLVGGAVWIALAAVAFIALRAARQASNRSGQDSNLRPAA